MDRGLWQEHVAEALGVAVTTICNWEGNHTSVATRFLPKVVAFLGYDPREESGQLGDRLRMGLTPRSCGSAGASGTPKRSSPTSPSASDRRK
jgi:hypothetical protein